MAPLGKNRLPFSDSPGSIGSNSVRTISCQMPETDKSEIGENALFFHLPKLQVNRQHQKADKRDAHDKPDLTVLKFFAAFSDERVGTFNGFFAWSRRLLETIPAERMHIRARFF